MIAEMLAALGAVKVAWESLEIVHMLHVGHIAGKAGYKGAGFINHAVGRQYQKFLDQKNPIQQLEREAKTLYDFDATGDAIHAIEDIEARAKAYLTTLKGSVNDLERAKNYFLKSHANLTELVSALIADEGHQFSSQLLQFKVNFESFKAKFNEYLVSIEPPPRQLLYIADTLSTTQVINQCNDYLIKIKGYIDQLKQIEEKITNEFQQGFDTIHTLLPRINSKSAHYFEQLKQAIELCMGSPEQISKTMHAALPNNTQVAIICIDILQLFASFQQAPTATEQTNPLENNPSWFPLLTAAEQIEVGQRIFLHAMSKAYHAEDKKLLFAKIFLRKHVPQYLFDQIEVELLAYEMARTLRKWQIKKCKPLIKFLNTLTQQEELPEEDFDGLLAWLQTHRAERSSIILFKKILVSPCCFGACNLNSALLKFRPLAPDENIDEIIQTHQDSNFGDIWEKNDVLIQLPKSFNTKILPRDRYEPDEDTSQQSNVVSSLIQKLAKALIEDLENLEKELINDYSFLEKKYKALFVNQKEVSKLQKNKEHDNGVKRIRKLHGYIDESSSSNSSIFPYLYNAKIINEDKKKRQVPTLHDLLHVIYRGVNPNNICHWKSTPVSLSYYFNPDQSRLNNVIKAWIYACNECNINVRVIYSCLHYSNNNRPLALGNTLKSKITIKNNFAIQISLKNRNKISSMVADSKVLKGSRVEITQQTEVFIQNLQNYQMLALVRVNPEYRKELSLFQQMKCVIKNLFKISKEIGYERLDSVNVYLGDFYILLGAEDINTVNKALKDFSMHYDERSKNAKHKHWSALYTTMQKVMDGPIAYMLKNRPEVHETQLELEEEKNTLEDEVKHLREIIDKMANEKTETELKNAQNLADQTAMYEAKLTQAKAESDAQRIQAKAEMEAKRMQDKEEMGANMKKILDLIQSQQPASAAASASNAETSESSFGGFFKFQ